jgi:serine/threonine protein kinase
MNDLCIKSDFSDFYDELHNEKSNFIYNRFLSECKQRGTALKYLRSIGIKTIDIKPVNTYFSTDGKIVVYTNPKGHNSNGKKIMSVDDAVIQYNNCIASKYIESNDITVKYLQIGKRRFTLYFKKDSQYTLELGQLVDISEAPSDYNRLIGLPIFSIDYIAIDNEMVATDFNEVENLQRIGIDKVLGKENVIEEIRGALITYNKI